ncbi:MAG: tRNA uridine(34) 5-carboxymethylaminomethyl modification radical SAM/GNAT enzyme Elp3 [Thermoplasmata archaeon]
MDPLETLVFRIVQNKVVSKKELQKEKFKICKKFGMSEVPGNAELIEATKKFLDKEEDRVKVIKLLKRKPARSLSGVAVIAVMTSPEKCPHGRCIVCPGGPDSRFSSPQSYTGREPAALRGVRNEFSGYEQVKDRLEQYHSIGHGTDKADLIIMGGTFPARPLKYQHEFVKDCLDALNGSKENCLKDAIKKNETAVNRCIGLTVETRPDYCGRTELKKMLSYGTTRVELGVQCLRDDILNNIQRGHGTEESIKATELCKDHGLKVCYHMMPGLPGSSPKQDLKDFERLFNHEEFMPDMIKIYPTLVVEGTELYNMWKRGEYSPLSTREAAKLVAKIKSVVPPYVRIQRVQRDIPSPLIQSGVKNSNLRQYVWDEMEKQGSACRCIRCREAGRRQVTLEKIELKHRTYKASGGTEHFLELGDGHLLIGYARLRVKEDHPPTLRELKVVGHMTPLDSDPISYQHTGCGNKLLEACESIASEWGKIRVTSGIGAREYYRDRGYALDGYYMVKSIP